MEGGRRDDQNGGEKKAFFDLWVIDTAIKKKGGGNRGAAKGELNFGSFGRWGGRH